MCGGRATGGRRTRAQLATLLCQQQVPRHAGSHASIQAPGRAGPPLGSPAPHSYTEPWQVAARDAVLDSDAPAGLRRVLPPDGQPRVGQPSRAHLPRRDLVPRRGPDRPALPGRPLPARAVTQTYLFNYLFWK
jgi:hypothetical protein